MRDPDYIIFPRLEICCSLWPFKGREIHCSGVWAEFWPYLGDRSRYRVNLGLIRSGFPSTVKMGILALVFFSQHPIRALGAPHDVALPKKFNCWFTKFFLIESTRTSCDALVSALPGIRTSAYSTTTNWTIAVKRSCKWFLLGSCSKTLHCWPVSYGRNCLKATAVAFTVHEGF